MNKFSWVITCFGYVFDKICCHMYKLIFELLEPLGNSDHNQIHFDINVKSESKNKKTYKRNFHKGNYKDMRKYLAKLDWNNMLTNKTAIECWNILKYEIESIIDKFVPFQKQGKRCGKKHLSKEAIRKNSVKTNYVEGL